jgi:peptidoglycan/LPS O-acetylase OafA/YrhL
MPSSDATPGRDLETPARAVPAALAAWWPWQSSWRRDPSHRASGRSPKLGFYPGLDLLRGFAAISVVILHVIEYFKWEDFPWDNALALWFRLGWMGVDLFFVISGFVITLSAFNILERDEAGYAREFCRRRLARIVPLHYLTCLVFMLFVSPALLFDDYFYVNALTHMTFTYNFMWKTIQSINPPNWTLGVEIQFYLLILLAAPLLLRRVRPLAALAVCISVAWTWRAWAFAVHCGEIRPGLIMTWFGIAQAPGALDEFGFGIMLAMVLHRDRDGRLHRFLHATRWLWPLAAATMASFTMGIYWPRSSFWDHWKMVVFWKTLLGATFLLVVVSACAINDRWVLVLTAPLRYLGTISYGIYLWHMLILFSLKPLLMGDPARACRWIVGLTVLLAALSWHLFEKPILERHARRRADARKTGELPGPTAHVRPAATERTVAEGA